MEINELSIVTETTSDSGQKTIEIINASIEPSPRAMLSAARCRKIVSRFELFGILFSR